MTVFPTELHVLPLHKIEQFPGENPIWPEISSADDVTFQRKDICSEWLKLYLDHQEYTCLELEVDAGWPKWYNDESEYDSQSLGESDSDYPSE